MFFKKKEAERREKAALDFAKVCKKNLIKSLKFKESDEQYLKEFDARVDAQREQVKVALKQAIEANDASQIMEANDKLTQLAVEKEKARLELSNREKKKKKKKLKKQQTTYKLNLKQRNHHNQHKLLQKLRSGLRKMNGLELMRS